MQSEVPETDFTVQITTTLKAAIEVVAASEGQTVAAWAASVLQAAAASSLQRAAEKRAVEEERGRRMQAKPEISVRDMDEQHRAANR